MTKAFSETSTTDEVLEGCDLKGRRILVTGVSSGLGVETARSLVAHGAEVVGTARDLSKAATATAAIKAIVDSGLGGFELVELDLASLSSVRECSKRLVADGKSFDIVIANAGIMAVPEGKSQDGFESHFATNHLGHFLFVNRVAPLIKDGGRVVIVSSSGHRWADVDLVDPNFEHVPYNPWVAYGRSKTANALFAVEFDHRHRVRGIRAASVHPGVIDTPLARHVPKEDIQAMINQINKVNETKGKPQFQFKSVPQGAATAVWVAVVADGDSVGGWYCEDCHLATISENPEENEGFLPYAVNPESAKKLWVKSEQMVGETFA